MNSFLAACTKYGGKKSIAKKRAIVDPLDEEAPITKALRMH